MNKCVCVYTNQAAATPALRKLRQEMERHCLRKKKKKHKQAGRQNVVSLVEPQSRSTVDGESVRSVLLGSDPLFLLLFFLNSIFFLHSNFGTGYWETKPTWYPFAHIEWNLIAAIDNKKFSLCSGKGIKTSGALKTSNICAWQCAGNKSVIYPCDYIAAQRHQVHVIQNYILAVSH